jgi:hypothetical protein
VSNRSRRERRERQQERALVQGDVGALEKLVAEGGRSAVAGVVRALGAPPAEAARAAELDALAVRLCRALRREGEPGQALAVAAAGARRTPELRREEALAAFAAGNDEVAAQLASMDEAIGAALGPLLQAVRGEVAGPGAAAPPLRAMHAAARAVAHVVRGEPHLAQAVLKRIPLASRVVVRSDQIFNAAALQVPEHALGALTQLDRSPRAPGDGEVRRLMASEAALRVEDFEHLPPRLAADPNVSRRVAPARLAAATSPGMIAEVVRQAGVEVFDVSERANAALFLGFTQIRSEPAAASRSFDRAIQLGADLVEALRGKVLAAVTLAHTFEDGDPEQRRAIRDAAGAADRLARALERSPRAGPLAAMAGKLAAAQWLGCDDARSALASIAKARPLAGGKLVDDLDLLEAEAVGLRSPREAEQRLEALTRRAPGNVEAWKRRAALAMSQGAVERAEAILVAAAEATKDPAITAEVREIRGMRGQLVPFEGFVPGVATAGALAQELARTTDDRGHGPHAPADVLRLAAPCRDALGPAARLAFDTAAIVIAVVQGTPAMAEERLRSAILTWRSSPRDLTRLVAVAALMNLGLEVVSVAKALDDDAPALTAIAEALAVAGRGKLVGKLLPRFSASLPRARVAFFQSLAGSAGQAVIPGVPDPEHAARELDLALAPELSILGFLRDDDDRSGGIPGLGLPGEGDILGDLLDTLGLPPEAARALPREKLRRLELQLIELVSKQPGPEVMMKIMDILNESGFSPGDFPARPPRPGKKR